uniref:Protein kinase domain-containing protein n=1 Tax=Parastrongyloides trichosuri TaxID=131310 RepID=A0A0N4ZAC8_PARTI
MKRFIYIFFFLWYIYTISATSIVGSNNLRSHYSDLVAITTYEDKIAVLNSKEIKIFQKNDSEDLNSRDLVSQIDIPKKPNDKKISEFKFINDHFISFCVACKKCVICPIYSSKNCTIAKIDRPRCTSVSITWDGDKNSLIFLRQTNSEKSSRSNSGFITSYSPEKLFIDYGSNFFLSIIGKSEDVDLSTGQEVVFSFAYQEYTYFLGYHKRRKDMERIIDHKQYDDYSEEDVSIAKLIRVCNKDESNDIITRIDITLTCDDFNIKNSFQATGAHIEKNKNKLYVSFKKVNDNKQQICSYNLNDLNMRFDEYWDTCQTGDINSSNKCGELSLTSYREGYEICSILSRRSNTQGDVICSKFGNQPYIISNCEAGSKEFLGMNHDKNGWLDCYHPFDGKLEGIFYSRISPTNFQLSTRTNLIFINDNTGNGEIFYPTLDKIYNLVKEQSSPYTIRYPYAISKSIEQLYDLDDETEIKVETINCSYIYKTCNDIQLSKTSQLNCKWCALENGFQNAINVNNKACGYHQTKGWIFDKNNTCPINIYSKKCDDNTITIGGNFLHRKLHFSACGNKINCNLSNTSATCFIPKDIKHCPFKIDDNVDEETTYHQYLYECSEKYNSSQASILQSSTPKNSTKLKWILSSIIIFLFIMLGTSLIYLKYYCSKRLESITTTISEVHEGHRKINSYTLSDLNVHNGYVLPKLSQNFFGDLSSDYIIQPNEYKLIEKIGSGNFGVIYSGILCRQHNKIHEKVALKELKSNEFEWLTWKREVAVLIECKHENVVDFKGMTYDKIHGYIMVMEYMENGDLKRYLMNPRNKPSIFQIIGWINNILDAMIHLHAKDFTHRDLSCRNILLSAFLEAKISDFGLSRELDKNGLYIGDKECPVPLPLQWTAPECYSGDAEYIFTRYNDVWAFSVVLWEMFSREAFPYPKMQSFEQYRDVALKEPLPFGNVNCQNIEDWKDLAKQCRDIIPENRPTFVQIKEIVQNIDKKTMNEEYIYKD